MSNEKVKKVLGLLFEHLSALRARAELVGSEESNQATNESPRDHAGDSAKGSSDNSNARAEVSTSRSHRRRNGCLGGDIVVGLKLIGALRADDDGHGRWVDADSMIE